MQAVILKGGLKVDYLKQFVIPYFGLKNGFHDFRFEINKEFFDHFEYSEIKNGDLLIRVELEKQDRMLIFRFNVSGTVDVPCDRCGVHFDQPVGIGEKLIIKLGHQRREESHEIIIIPETDHEVDLSGFLYEYIILSLPVKRVHPADKDGNSTCDPEMLRILEDHAPEFPRDPRWDALKKLKNNHKSK